MRCRRCRASAQPRGYLEVASALTPIGQLPTRLARTLNLLALAWHPPAHPDLLLFLARHMAHLIVSVFESYHGRHRRRGNWSQGPAKPAAEALLASSWTYRVPQIMTEAHHRGCPCYAPCFHKNLHIYITRALAPDSRLADLSALHHTTARRIRLYKPSPLLALGTTFQNLTPWNATLDETGDSGVDATHSRVLFVTETDRGLPEGMVV